MNISISIFKDYIARNNLKLCIRRSYYILNNNATLASISVAFFSLHVVVRSDAPEGQFDGTLTHQRIPRVSDVSSFDFGFSIKFRFVFYLEKYFVL